MYVDANLGQAALEASNEASGPLFKIKDDPRVTSVGRILRRYSIDEMPQVLNVLRGEMSLVGPRPLPLRDYVPLEDWHRKRYLVLPGMTGLWQVSGRIDLSFDDLVRLDFYYLENWSIWLDISILPKTLPAVAARRGPSGATAARWKFAFSEPGTGSRSAGTARSSASPAAFSASTSGAPSGRTRAR